MRRPALGFPPARIARGGDKLGELGVGGFGFGDGEGGELRDMGRIARGVFGTDGVFAGGDDDEEVAVGAVYFLRCFGGCGSAERKEAEGDD